MKFSFESQQYRDNTAKQLKETEKSERKEALEKKRKELKFVLAEHIRDFNRKNDKKRKEGSVDGKSEDQEGKVERKKIFGKIESHLRGSEEFGVEIETIDISDQIPESVQIIYDMNRLLEVEYTYSDDEVSRGWYHKDEDSPNAKHHNNSPEGYINRDPYYDLDSIDIIIEKYIKMAEQERGEPLTTDSGTIIYNEELKKIAEQAKKDFVEFRERMTEGLASNPRVLYHTVGAHTGGFSSDWYRSTMKSEDEVKNKLRNRFPNNTEGSEIQEKPLEINEDLVSRGLWVNAGKVAFNNTLKPLMLIDTTSPRFKKYISYMVTRENRGGYDTRDEIEESFEDPDARDVWGIELQPRKPPYVHWLSIADQIFDPYHGRMIKIKEIETPEIKEERSDW